MEVDMDSHQEQDHRHPVTEEIIWEVWGKSKKNFRAEIFFNIPSWNFQPFFSLGHSSYRILSDNEDKYICEVPVDPIFMLHTDKIAVKVLKNTVTITSNGEFMKNHWLRVIHQNFQFWKRKRMNLEMKLTKIGNWTSVWHYQKIAILTQSMSFVTKRKL